MASISDVQHRFANKLAGKNGCISASSCRYEGRNFYSYSTVFGQWLDMEKNVVAIFDGSTSISSGKHKLYKGLFPDDVHVFPLDFKGGYYGWRNCNLVSSYNFNDEDFKEYHRMQMIDHYVERIYNQLSAIKDGKKKGLEKVDFSAWGYVDELCSLYKDTTINKWCKQSTDKDKVKLVKLLNDGERNVETLTDALFGEGTYKTYWDYCARYRKAADKRAKVEALCNRLGIASPYESWSRGCMDTELTVEQIRKLTAKERVELHFKALAYKEYKEHKDERKKKYNKNRENAFKWIVGYECDKKKGWCGYEYDDKVTKCRNMFTGEEYNISGEYIYGFYWGNTEMSFNYDDFRKSEDKTAWIEQFYAKVKEVQDTRAAIAFLKKYGVLKQKQNKYDNDIYLGVTQVGAREATGEDMRVVNEFIARQDAYFAEQERIKRAREIERIRREEEERKEREYMEQVKQEQIDECLERGEEGCRDLWRKHLMDIHYAERETNYKGDFYMGGNVLLRLNLNKDKVETSKNIRIPVDTCKKMWKIVSKWHENPSCFKSMQIDTKGSGKYTISSYENDILTAGCHKIAYTEMERMYNEIIASV
jgi:hypothetical protein